MATPPQARGIPLDAHPPIELRETEPLPKTSDLISSYPWLHSVTLQSLHRNRGDSPAAERELDKLDQQIARRILSFLHDRVAKLDDPRSIGEALKGSRFGAFWKCRIGDYRIIASIEDDALRILVVRIGNRKAVYRKEMK
ncbi:MAG: type II toxin-antitoxin system RelE/ParE family toxin [Acidithiobacillus sp.]